MGYLIQVFVLPGSRSTDFCCWVTLKNAGVPLTGRWLFLPLIYKTFAEDSSLTFHLVDAFLKESANFLRECDLQPSWLYQAPKICQLVWCVAVALYWWLEALEHGLGLKTISSHCIHHFCFLQHLLKEVDRFLKWFQVPKDSVNPILHSYHLICWACCLWDWACTGLIEILGTAVRRSNGRWTFTLILIKALCGRDEEAFGCGHRGCGSCGSGSLNVLSRHGVRQIWGNSRRGVGEVQARNSWLSFQAHHTRIVRPGSHLGCGEWPQPNALLGVWISNLRDPLPPRPHAHPFELRRLRRRRDWAPSLGGSSLFRKTVFSRPSVKIASSSGHQGRLGFRLLHHLLHTQQPSPVPQNPTTQTSLFFFSTILTYPHTTKRALCGIRHCCLLLLLLLC